MPGYGVEKCKSSGFSARDCHSERRWCRDKLQVPKFLATSYTVYTNTLT